AAHQLAEDLLGPALAVLVRSVVEVDARAAAGLVHCRGGGLIGVPAEGHGAEAQFGDLHAGTAEGLEFHRRILACQMRYSLRETEREVIVKFLAAAVFMLWSALAPAQGFPSKPMRILVPSPAGSSPDIRARQIGQKLAEALGQPVIVENRPGANGLIAAREAARSAPDGHTMFLALINNAIGDALKPDPCCRLGQELAPVSRFTMTPLIFVVNASQPIASVKEYIERAKSKPGELTYASAGPGSISELVGEWIKFETGIKLLEVPYKGVNAEVPDLIGGQVITAFLV